MFNLNFIRKDSLTKFIYNSIFILPIINNVDIFLNIKNISKINKNIVLKSLGLFDILIMQKSLIKILKNKEKNKNKQKKYSILYKINLKKYKMFIFLRYLDIIILSEMYNRHLFYNNKININYYSFNINNINIFKLLDSSYFNWNHMLYINLLCKNNLFNLILKKK